MKALGIVLMVLGALFGIGGLAAPVVGANTAVSKVNETDSTTYVSGVLPKLLNTSKVVADPTNPYDENVPIEQVRVTQSNAEAMEQQDAKDAGASIFNTTATTTRTDTGEELSVSEAQYAFDPANSELINCCGASIGGNTDVNFSGVMPLKFPFGSPQGDVQIWNDTIQAPVTATYVETVNEYDMELYRYQISIPVTQTPAPPLEVPAALAVGLANQLAPQLVSQIPAEGNVGLYDFYTAESSYLVEPLTGQIVDGRTVDKTTLRLDGGTEDIVTKVETDAGSANVEEGAAEIKSSADLLKTVGTATPAGLGAGAIAFLSGLGLTIAGSRKKKKEAEAAQKPAVTSPSKPAAPAAAAPAAAATAAGAAGAAKAAQPADIEAKAAEAKRAAEEAKRATDAKAEEAKRAADAQADKAKHEAEEAKKAADAQADKAKHEAEEAKKATDAQAEEAKKAADAQAEAAKKAAEEQAAKAESAGTRAVDDVKMAGDDAVADTKAAADDAVADAKGAGDDLKAAADDLINKAKDQFGGGSSGGTTGGGNPTT